MREDAVDGVAAECDLSICVMARAEPRAKALRFRTLGSCGRLPARCSDRVRIIGSPEANGLGLSGWSD